MNIRIEQAATPVPQSADRTKRRLSRGLTDARRLAARALFRSVEESGSRPLTLVRRGTSCLAVAVAALAVSASPSTALGATSSAGASAASSATPTAGPTAHVRHHIPDTTSFPDPGAMTFESWSAAGWSLSAPDPMVDTRCFTFPHHHRCAPWLYQPAPSTGLPGTPADGSRRTGEALPVSQTPIGSPFSDLPRPALSADQPAGDGVTVPSTRIRIISTPVTANTAPATPEAPAAPKRIHRSDATTTPRSSPCFRAAYLVGKDRRMLAHLRPAADAMGVVLNHRHAPCAAMVDYLSQTRA